jgi:hypothetical protein
MKRQSLKVKVNRLFVKKVGDSTKFFASIRDYIVEKAKKEKKDLIVFCKELNEEIIVPYEKLEEGIKNKEKFKSKINGKMYSLIDFDWHKYKKPNLNNPRLFSQLIL